MSAVRAIVHALLNNVEVAAIVGNRVFALEAPQGAVQSQLVVSMGFEADESLLDGGGRWFRSTVSVECLALSAAAAMELGERVKDAIAYLTNYLVTDGASPPEFATQITVLKEGADIADVSDDRRVFGRTIDFTVRWRNADAA